MQASCRSLSSSESDGWLFVAAYGLRFGMRVMGALVRHGTVRTTRDPGFGHHSLVLVKCARALPATRALGISPMDSSSSFRDGKLQDEQ